MNRRNHDRLDKLEQTIAPIRSSVLIVPEEATEATWPPVVAKERARVAEEKRKKANNNFLTDKR